MTSSEKILAGIAEQAEAQAADILRHAREAAEQTVAEQKAAAEQTAAQTVTDAQKKADRIRATGDSSAALLKRDAALTEKRALIEKTLLSLKEHILSFDDEKYFSCLLGLVKCYRQDEPGTLSLSARDLSRDTKGFRQKLAALSVTLSDTPADIDGGFLLQYREILINGGLSALIREKHDKLTDVIHQSLFG